MSTSNLDPTIWTRVLSKSKNRYYYFNSSTGECRWDIEETPNNVSSLSIGTNDTLKAEEVLREERIPKRVKVETSSYQPPVSGSAADLKLIISRALPYPKIIPALPHTSETMWERQDIQVNDYLASVYRDGFIVDNDGVNQKFKDTTNPIQGKHLYNLVAENKWTNTLEVGLAMGASAVWICQAHKDNNNIGSNHIAIDPNQTEQYKNMGRTLVSRSGLASYMNVMEMTSYRALPILLERVLKNEIPKFQMIYIDGWHTFDYTLVDFFYADLILEVHGVIVLDDIKHAPVQKCFKYIETNYPNYQVVDETPCFKTGNPKISSQATFVKCAEDTRVWNAHVEF